MNTFGPAYDERLDGERIAKQHEVIRDFMLDGAWRSLPQIHAATGYPEASISAQLRHLRKPQFGGYEVSKRRIAETGLWEYHVAARQPSGGELFDFTPREEMPL